MAITGSVKTLYEDKEKTEAIFPRTKASAITDDNNKNVQLILDELSTDVEEALDLFLYGTSEQETLDRLNSILGV